MRRKRGKIAIRSPRAPHAAHAPAHAAQAPGERFPSVMHKCARSMHFLALTWVFTYFSVVLRMYDAILYAPIGALRVSTRKAKRETGENPVQTRYCDQDARLHEKRFGDKRFSVTADPAGRRRCAKLSARKPAYGKTYRMATRTWSDANKGVAAKPCFCLPCPQLTSGPWRKLTGFFRKGNHEEKVSFSMRVRRNGSCLGMLPCRVRQLRRV